MSHLQSLYKDLDPSLAAYVCCFCHFCTVYADMKLLCFCSSYITSQRASLADASIFLFFLLFTIFFIISLLSRRTLSFLAHIHQRSVVSSFFALKAYKINMSITTDLKYVQARHDVRRVPHSFVYHTIFAAN